MNINLVKAVFQLAANPRSLTRLHTGELLPCHEPCWLDATAHKEPYSGEVFGLKTFFRLPNAACQQLKFHSRTAAAIQTPLCTVFDRFLDDLSHSDTCTIQSRSRKLLGTCATARKSMKEYTLAELIYTWVSRICEEVKGCQHVSLLAAEEVVAGPSWGDNTRGANARRRVESRMALNVSDLLQ